MSSKHVLIVGGSSGIGFATAAKLLAQGFKVTIAGRSAEKLAAAQSALSGEVFTISLNAADLSSLTTVLSHVGYIDHLVLAFGSGKGVGPFSTIDVENVRLGFEEKVFPHFACAQAALAQLAPHGSITFISAVTAQAAMPGTAGIGAANAAIAALVPTLASELRPRRVNAVSPGIIDTPWWDFLTHEQKTGLFNDYASQTPVGRIGKAEDVAHVIDFLITNSFVTGQVVVCDGGLQLGK